MEFQEHYQLKLELFMLKINFYHNKEDPSFNQCLSAFKSQIIECDDISKNKSQINLKVEKAEYEAPNHHV